MEPLSIQEVRNAVRGDFESLPDTDQVLGVSTDTRTLKEGELFIALRGPKFDGHDFIGNAVRAGASAVICAKGSGTGADVCRIGVRDTLQALGDLAAYHRNRLSIRIIGVTGSNGKTTTKDMIHHVLSGFAPTGKSIASYNNLVGLPLSLFQIDWRWRFAIIEMGTSAPDEISRLSRIARPEISIVTSVSETHLEGLGSIEGVADAKMEIIHGMDDSGLLILNGDDERCAAMSARFPGKSFTFGFGKGVNVRCISWKTHGSTTVFALADGMECELPLLGRHNILNALACITVCLRVGMAREKIAGRLSDFTAPEMRGAIRISRGITVINDCYNANPASFRAAIEILNEVQATRRVLVCGDMAELGNRSQELHRELGRTTSGEVDVLVCVGKLARSVGDAAIESGMSKKKVSFFPSSNKAADSILSIVKKGDAVLIKGSRTMKMERVVKEVCDAV